MTFSYVFLLIETLNINDLELFLGQRIKRQGYSRVRIELGNKNSQFENVLENVTVKS